MRDSKWNAVKAVLHAFFTVIMAICMYVNWNDPWNLVADTILFIANLELCFYYLSKV